MFKEYNVTYIYKRLLHIDNESWTHDRLGAKLNLLNFDFFF